MLKFTIVFTAERRIEVQAEIRQPVERPAASEVTPPINSTNQGNSNSKIMGLPAASNRAMSAPVHATLTAIAIAITWR